MTLAIDHPHRVSDSSLDTLPNSHQQPTPYAIEHDYRMQKHRGMCLQLERWIQNCCDDERLKARLNACGTNAWVETSASTGRARVRANKCGTRLCPACRACWSLRQQEKITLAASEIARPRLKLATLTLRNSSQPLPDCVASLWEAFRRLKNSRLWTKAVYGCIAIIETTYNEANDTWHPHLHLILDANFIPQADLSTKWKNCTKGSPICDIRAIKDLSHVAAYVSKYLTKPVRLPPTVPLARLNELYQTYRSKRLLRFTGSMRLDPRIEIWKPEEPSDWTPKMTLTEYLRRLVEHDPEALELAKRISAERELYKSNPYADES